MVTVDGQELGVPPLRFQLSQAVGGHLDLELEFDRQRLVPDGDLLAFAGQKRGKALVLEIGEGDHAGRLGGHIRGIRFTESRVFLSCGGAADRLDGQRRLRGFEQMSIPEIIEQVFGEFGACTVHRAANEVAFRFVQQFNETNFRFGKRIGSYGGYFFYDTADGVVATTEPVGAPIELARGDLEWNSVELDITATPEACEARGLPYDAPEAVHAVVNRAPGENVPAARAVARDAANEYFGEQPDQSIDNRFDPGQLTDVLRERARAGGCGSVRYHFRTFHPAVQVGSVVRCEGHDILDGDLFVTRADAVFDRADGYACSIVAIPVSMAAPVSEPASVFGAPVLTAVVADCVDPEGLGRVQLEYPWSEAGRVWARVACLGAGENRGQVWTPRVGDEVLVAFECGDPSQPIVLGSLYSTRTAPEVATPNGSEELLIKTAIGEIRVIETPGHESLTIKLDELECFIRLQPQGPVIEIRGDGDVTVAAAGTLKLEGRIVDIRGEQVRINSP